MMYSFLVLAKNSSKQFSILDFVSCIVFLYILACTIATYIYPPISRLDFYTYIAATKAATNGLPLYTALYKESSFTYPPSIFLFFLPFLSLPVALATSIWNSLSLFSILLCSYLLLTTVQKRVRLAFAFLIFGAMLVSEPFRETLLFGQNNAAVLLFILLSFFFSQKKASRYHIVGGIFFGIATALKVFPVFLLIYFLCKKQWVVSGVGVCVFLLFLIAGTFGHIQYIWDYIHFSRTVISSSVAISKDQSFSSLLLFTFPYMQNFQTTITMGVYASSVFVCSVLWKKLPKELLSDFFFFSSVLGCTILIITPLAWIHHLLFVFPFCIFLFAQAVSKKDTFSIVLFLLTLFLILFNGEYVILFLRSRHFTEIPFIQFHALLGLFIGLIGEYIYLTYSKA